MKICCSLSLLFTLAGTIFAMPVYNGWKLTPDAEKKLAEYTRAAANCRLKNNKTECESDSPLLTERSKEETGMNQRDDDADEKKRKHFLFYIFKMDKAENPMSQKNTESLLLYLKNIISDNKKNDKGSK